MGSEPLSSEPWSKESGGFVDGPITVSLFQIAVEAGATPLQSALTELTLDTNTGEAEGLFELLQLVTRQILTYRHAWTHYRASSQTVESPDAAENLFDQLLLRERSKFSAETLTNVAGVLQQQAKPLPSTPSGQSGYLVITLLLGTQAAAPSLTSISTAAALEVELQSILQMQPEQLLVLEVLWTPQQINEVVTPRELAEFFGDLQAIA